MFFFRFIYFLPFILINTVVFGNSNPMDTIVIQTGQCKTIETGLHRQKIVIWTTDNQDILSVDHVFGRGKICGVKEGSTYIHGSSPTDRGISIRYFVRVMPGTNNMDNVKSTILKSYQPNVDADVDKVLQEILSSQISANFESKLKVSGNNRFLVFKDSNKPFLFLSQTLWSMTRRLSREQVLQVLDICKELGFTAVQFIAHSHDMGINVLGDVPFENENYLRPVITVGNDLNSQEEYDWWDHVEFIIQECVKREMFVCLLPTWREQWNDPKKNLNQNNAFAYGKFLGQRYRSYNPWIIWVMGGDEAPDTPQKLNIQRELARGITWGVTGRDDYDQVIMSYHTHGPATTSDFIDESEPFMDFNMIQSGHRLENLEGIIEKTYQGQNKPVLDFEPLYQRAGNNNTNDNTNDIENNTTSSNTNEVRNTIYWGIFSGGFGTSYGSGNLWSLGERSSSFTIPNSFFEGFGLQIKHLGKLLTSKPMLVRVPNQDFLLGNKTAGLDRILACTTTDKSYGMVYTPSGDSFTVDLSYIKGNNLHWYWFNPRTGEIDSCGSFRKKNDQHVFTPPTAGLRFSGNDWVLIMDNHKWVK